MKNYLIILTLLLFPLCTKAIDCSGINGNSIFGYNGSNYEFIGSITNSFGSNSIANEYGSYGNKYNSKSIFNEYGRYGNKYASYSAFNEYTLNPPVIIDKNLNIVGYVTTNKYKLNPVHPNIAKYCAEYSLASTISNHKDLEFNKLSDLSSPKSYSSPSVDYETLLKILEENQSACPQDSSKETDGKCYCNSGYKVNDSKTGCYKITCPVNSQLIGNECVCNSGYIKNGEACYTYTQNCQFNYGDHIYGDNENCYCETGYMWDGVNSKCILQQLPANNEDTNNKSDIENFISKEKKLVVKIDYILTERLKGKILLQIEDKGQAWYVNPKNGKRYYMANGSEAFNIMKTLGVGITNKNLDKIKNNKTEAKKQSGKIFLQIEDKGQAFYFDFNGNANYLKDGSQAYSIMRTLGLGIKSLDLNKIEIQ